MMHMSQCDLSNHSRTFCTHTQTWIMLRIIEKSTLWKCDSFPSHIYGIAPCVHADICANIILPLQARMFQSKTSMNKCNLSDHCVQLQGQVSEFRTFSHSVSVFEKLGRRKEKPDITLSKKFSASGHPLHYIILHLLQISQSYS